MIAPTQLKKPSNWQDFEKLCKLLWGEIWVCEDTIKPVSYTHLDAYKRQS